jgi:hypothetical protein
MNYLVTIVIAIVLAAVAKEFRHLFEVSVGYDGLLYDKPGKAGSPEHKPGDGAT